MCAREIEPLRYSKHMVECCQVLLDNAQYSTDANAVHLVRLHGVAGKISQTFDSEEWDHPLCFNSTPVGSCVKAIKSELDTLKVSPARGLDAYGEFD
jgi:hypothetical protein